MFQLGSRLVHFQFASGTAQCSGINRSVDQPSEEPSSRSSAQPSAPPSAPPSAQSSVKLPSCQPSRSSSVQTSVQPSNNPSPQSSIQPSLSVSDLIVKLRNIGGLKKDDIFCNLRIPNQFQTAKEEVSLLIVTGRGIFCIDVKDWRGEVSVQKQNWQLKLKQEGQNITNVWQVPDPIQAITTKAANLWNHVKRSGVSVRRSLFLPRVLFLSANCQLDEELRQRRELVSHGSLDTFVCSLKEGYVAWMSDALTPSWLSGHLSYRQLRGVRETLRRTGTWDLVRLCSGEQLKGDYQGCQYIALDRQETEELEFSGDRALWMGSLWALLGHSPQVAVKMYKRGSGGWLGRTLSGSATIPNSAQVVFRISGDSADARIPASCIHSISLSI